MVCIKNVKQVKKLPDPLTGDDERDAVLAYMAEYLDPRVVAYVTRGKLTNT